MKKLASILFASLVSLMVVAISPLSHVSALQSQSAHHHGTISSTSEHCPTLCQSSPVKKDDLTDIDSEDDDEPQPPYYLQFNSAHSSFFVEKATTSPSVYVPDKVPKYRLCCVIRR